MNVALRARDALLRQPLVYGLWQAPFAGRKLAPLERHNDLGRIRRVLDVACGPGTNTAHFAHADYVGVDINPAYIETARRRHGRAFRIADVTRYRHEDGQPFDFILVNSFFHHLSTADARRVLSHLATLLTEDGHVHILDLVLPPRRGIARTLARWDRGDYARPLAEWRSLFEEHFTTSVFEPYALGLPSVALWQMVYFKGARR